jgi:uroporphyrinogen-III decarboxylase
MTSLERTISFIDGKPVDRPPFHPIIMRWAAWYAGVKYRKFCTDPVTKCRAMIKCARDFDIDWVTVMSDPWAEASAFGILVDYPENSLPVDTGGHFDSARAAASLVKYKPLENIRCKGELKRYGNTVNSLVMNILLLAGLKVRSLNTSTFVVHQALPWIFFQNLQMLKQQWIL